ncbi:hypothetical protein C8Q80DRAFT_1111999, partial [Daedaleopsis nitida]
SHRVATEAVFIITSLPNVEPPAAERTVHQLDAVRQILLHLDDPHSSPEETESLIEHRLWRDVRKDCLETFRQIFMHLEETGVLDMNNRVHRVCLFLVFHARIQAALDRARDAWNHHKLRTERNRTPVALYELSREIAIRRGYWTGDPGHTVEDVEDPLYGVDGHAPAPPPGETHGEPSRLSQQPRNEEERRAGVTTNTDSELDESRRILHNFNFDVDDGNWGIKLFCQVVATYNSRNV